MSIEVRTGETYNGTLTSVDHLMNVVLKDVICTSADAETFTKTPVIFLRGNMTKYVQVAEQMMDQVMERISEIEREKEFARSEHKFSDKKHNQHTKTNDARKNVVGSKQVGGQRRKQRIPKVSNKE